MSGHHKWSTIKWRKRASDALFYSWGLQIEGIPGGATPVHWGSVWKPNGSLYLAERPVTYLDIGQVAIDLMFD